VTNRYAAAAIGGFKEKQRRAISIEVWILTRSNHISQSIWPVKRGIYISSFETMYGILK
jgi:hypothetical protein